MAPASDSRFRRWAVPIFAVLVGLALAVPALAVPVNVTVTPAPGCDNLPPPESLDELGNGFASIPPGPFPADEEIMSADALDPRIACPPFDLPQPNTLVSITNLTGRDWLDVWYVSDPETSLSNVDQFLVNGQEAFKIDYAGINVPLVFESMAADAVFQAGETWEFIIDDYFNTLGLAASLLDSCAGGPPCTSGLVGNLSAGGPPSSGSIIAFIPEPGTILLAGFALTGLALLGRKRPKE